jgi:hypothetical protein
MLTPYRMTLAEFREAIRQFLNLRCVQCDRRLVCSECDAPIEYFGTLLSIHDLAVTDACVSLHDQAWHFAVPYCSRCEVKPNARGCVHLPHTGFSKAS